MITVLRKLTLKRKTQFMVQEGSLFITKDLKTQLNSIPKMTENHSFLNLISFISLFTVVNISFISYFYVFI